MSAPLDEIRAAALSPADYLAEMERQASAVLPSDADEVARERHEFTGLNLHRTRRIGRTWHPDADLVAAFRALPGPQEWLVLTEPWCGDSAQCLPQFEALAAIRDDITLHVVLRDAHLDLMDRYLTGGKRSIPIVVGFAADGDELFRWGPRPAAAQAVFDAAKAEGLAKPQILEKLHLFYGRDRGQALAAELRDLWAAAGKPR